MDPALHNLVWLFCFATALWFGLTAWKSSQNVFPWALTGALLGLVISTIVFGLRSAAFIPMSNNAVTHFRITTIVIALVLVILPDLLFLRVCRRQATVVG